MEKSIIDFYTIYNERNRLTERHSLERIRSQLIIGRYLRSNKLKILDIGGAAGIYSFWLASLGNIVDLIDITPKHIEQAKDYEENQSIKLNSMQIGDACNLPYTNDFYDIVLLMGPLYHLQKIDDRIKALSEAKRVLKNDGVIFVAAISRYASMFDGYIRNMIIDEEFYSIMKEDMKSGNHQNRTNDPRYFTKAYFHDVDGLKREIEMVGINCEKIIAVEGFGLCIPDIEKKMEDELFASKILNDLNELEEDKTIIGLSAHYLAVGKK